MAKSPLIPLELMQRHRVAPLKCEQNTLFLGMVNTTDQSALSAISFHTGLKIQPSTISEEKLNHLLNEITENDEQTILFTQLTHTLSKIPSIEEKPTTAEKEDEPVTEFVNELIKDAIKKKISDIHIEPYETYCRVRYRSDGLLYEAARIPLYLFERISTRFKIMAQINIAENRLPQDGRIQPHWCNHVELRVSTCPTLFGEKMVLRILNNQNTALDISALGLTDEQQTLFISKLLSPQGMILVTGPTGSGKTITLYSALCYLNHIEKNILSIEDPVEIELAGINQINTNKKIGLDFATILRALLRQDPDIIMVGEIRDLETAKIAMQAAQTGHLVLSTLHANSAVEAISRLQVLGIDTYHLISSLSLIVAQRLVRKRCSHQCANGCKHCHQGYKGRIGVFELLPITKEMIELITTGATTEQLLQQCKHAGWPLLHETGLLKVKEGATTYNELNRVLAC
jgi:type IV pilus assembly protein PilB